MLVDELREAKGARHAGGASTDDDDVSLHLGAVDAFEGFAKNQHLAGRHWAKTSWPRIFADQRGSRDWLL